MLIKEKSQLRIGDIVKFTGPNFQNINNKQTYNVIVKEIYPHWILGNVIDYENNDDVILKVCMTNVELVMQGIYKVEDIKENGFNVPLKELPTEETLKKIDEFAKTHSTILYSQGK